jgi:8-oxo-dGTP pyrophosphatase MutT (NUDIX family)
MSPWPTTSSKQIYSNDWIEVREDQVTRPDGKPGIYGVVTVKEPAVFIVALTSEEEVALIEVDRHTVGNSLEVPAGAADGDLPMEAAKRELLEEAGMVAADWRQLGRIASLNGVCEAPGFVFLALDAVPAPDEGAVRASQAAEGINEVRLVPLLDVFELVRTGGITDGETVAALMHAAVYLDRVM